MISFFPNLIFLSSSPGEERALKDFHFLFLCRVLVFPFHDIINDLSCADIPISWAPFLLSLPSSSTFFESRPTLPILLPRSSLLSEHSHLCSGLMCVLNSLLL